MSILKGLCVFGMIFCAGFGFYGLLWGLLEKKEFSDVAMFIFLAASMITFFWYGFKTL